MEPEFDMEPENQPLEKEIAFETIRDVHVGETH